MRKILFLGVFVFLSGLFFAESGEAKEVLHQRILDADAVMKEFLQVPEKSIPPSLLGQAKAIGIFPGVAKAGFIVAGKFGQGIMIHKDPNTGRWSAPAFFKIAGGSVGWQLGADVTDLILVVTNERGVNALLENKFTLGADLNVAAGPLGRNAEANTDWKLTANVLSYSRSKGLFAGVSLKGTVISQDQESNDAYYGAGVTANEILFSGKVQPTPQAQKLIQTIQSYST